MGSAKETEALQLLNQEAVPEDADKPITSSPCGCRKNSCLQHVSCASGDFTMRNCCVNELGTKDSSQKVAMVDNPNQKEKAQAVDPKSSLDLVAAAAAEPPLLKNTGVGGTPPEAKGEAATCHEWKQNSKQDERMEEISNSTVTICSSLEKKVSPVAGEACRHLPTEPCLKGPNKDSSSTPTSLKHVAFFEPTTGKAKEECSQIKTVHSKMGSTLPACLQNTSQGQPLASKGDKSHISSEAMEYGKEDSRSLFGSDAMKESILEPSKDETTSERSAKPVAAKNPLSDTEETRFPVAETHPPGSSNKVPDVLVTSISYEVKHQGTSGELESSPAESMEEKTGHREPTISSCQSQDQTHGKKVEMISRATSEEHATNEEMASVGHLAQTCILEVTPPQHDAGTQVDNRVSLVSVAISPINPPDGSSAFPFHTRGLGTSLKSPGPEEKPTKRDVEMQVSIPVETRSVATGPMTPVTKSPQSSYPEVHIKSAEEETSEPIREVSWDEKGMTWEVYGASMEVEVLGMAIQKHLEKQIEEHGRQMVMTPQSTRSSSVKAATRKGEIKRQPSVFRALLQNVRRPRCCSRGGPAVE